MTDIPAPGEFRLKRRVERPAVNPFAELLDGELQESPLRLTVAVGFDAHVHLRKADAKKTLCGKPAHEFADETKEAHAAGGRRGCKSCVKRAHPGERTSALCRSTQLIARTTMGGRP